MSPTPDEQPESVQRQALELLDAKRAYLRFLDSPLNRRIMDEKRDSGFRQQNIDHTADLEIDSVRAAQNFWVAPDMVSVVDAAFATMPDEDVLLEEPPAPKGFLLMGHPYTQRCSDPECGEDHPFIGFHWRPAHRVLPANEHTDEQHDDGLFFTWLAPTTERERRVMPTPFSPVNSGIFIPAGRPLNTSYSVEIGAMSPQSAALCKYARAMWTLMQQPLASTGEAQPYRALRRRLEKAGQPPAPVTVVTLRRRKEAAHAGDGTPVDWSHRWVVRGHWRNQWHPRLKQHRAMWINEHVKGPDDKPLVVKDKVVVWNR